MTEAERTGQYEERGETKTDMSCTECGKLFVALLDFRIDGNHIIECPWCGHGHCRVIQKGKVTGDRWSTTYGTDAERHGVRARRTWKINSLPATTTTAASFIRERWLDKYG
jgi:DNA-directed RNA polymerase subunit RPC12/RpoP